MHFWLTFAHIAAMAVWFAGLFLLPRLLIAHAHAGGAGGIDESRATGGMLYFHVMTPAAVITIVLGTALLAYGFEGAWLPAKLAIVTLVVLLHVYLGQLLLDSWTRQAAHTALFYRVLNWIPLVLLLGIAALAAAKPAALPPLGGV